MEKVLGIKSKGGRGRVGWFIAVRTSDKKKGLNTEILLEDTRIGIENSNYCHNWSEEIQALLTAPVLSGKFYI